MSVDPLGMIGSVAGIPGSQTKGSPVETTAQDTADRARRREAVQRAENAAGIGQAAEGSETNDRDADGRRPWEAPEETNTAEPAETPPAETDRGQHSSGEPGHLIDLSG
jgi:hypothetical protein